MIKKGATLTDGNGTAGPKAYGFGPGVRASVYPLAKGGALVASDPKESQEGGPGSGRVPEGQEPKGQNNGGGKRPGVLAHFTYDGDRYKAGVRIPKDDMPPREPNWKTKKETTSGSAQTPQLRSKESKRKSFFKKYGTVFPINQKDFIEKSYSRSNGSMQIQSHFKESDSESQGSRFKVILIQEGMGNLRDCFYYTKESLQSAEASKLFEGKKCFADHPSSIEEESRPERSTRDILGHFENVTYEESNGRGRLIGDLVTVPDPSYDWAKALLKNSIDFAKRFPDEDFVGLSINASGEATEVPLDQFMKETDIPKSVLPKIEQALAEGIQSIRPVSVLKDAVSCDLVTEAGAGGKILQMLEQERNPMKTKRKTKESQDEGKKESHEKKESQEKNESKHESKEDGMEGANPDHADEEQDKALIQKMIKQYLGDDHAEDEEAHEMGKHAFECCQSEGMSSEEAYEAAGKHLSMAKKIGGKMAGKPSKDAEDTEESDDKATESEEHEECGKESDEDKKEKKESHKESKGCRACITKSAENSKLKESLRKYELSDYLDKKLKESKKGHKFQTDFREALGKPESKTHIDQSLKLFSTAFEKASSDEEFSAFVMTEKTTFKESDSGASGTLEDCLN